MAKQYLNVNYKDKDLAKRLGARWDSSVRKWYVVQGSELARVLGWRAPRTKLVERAEFNLLAAMKTHKTGGNVPPRQEPSQLSLLG